VLEPLPIDEHLPAILDLVRARRAVVVVAPPGAGKTTRVAPALAVDGPVILLQPRRIAARSLARRIAAEREWTLGNEVGWQVRFERRFSGSTRVLVATEGILTRRLQGDPLLSGFRTVILDEFHERTLHADLGLALARQASVARPELRVVVMSATLDAGRVARFLDDCPVVEVSGRLHPIEVEYAPRATPVEAIRQTLSRTTGHVLCFLPGAPEIRRVSRELGASTLPGAPADVLPLHGSLPANEQDAALAESSRRKLILATNIAETSLTVEGVTDVVDSGLQKILRRDEGLGIDRLEISRISSDSADQRAGRAGRTRPGHALRLWDRRDRLEPHREAEIRRVDLAGPLLEILAWGGDPASFEWFEPPPRDSVDAAMRLLTEFGAVDGGRITERGRRLRGVSAHPRLAHVLLEARGADSAAAACAAISEGWRLRGTVEVTSSDALSLADRIREAPARVRRAAEALAKDARRIAKATEEGSREGSETLVRRALLAGYPDRVGQRREPGSSRLLMASGHGARLSRDSGVREGEFLVALDVVAGTRGPGSEALVRMASLVDPEWLDVTDVKVEHRFDPGSETVRAVECTCHRSLVLSRKPVPPDPETASRMLAEILLQRGPGEESVPLLRRLKFAEIAIDLDALLREACFGKTVLPGVDLEKLLPYEAGRDLDRLAPRTIRVPSGRRVPLEYREDGTVAASVKLQELFGLAETPRVGAAGEPVTFSLLAPNGRPVQTTRDLHSFWERTYPEVRKQLRGRYPKHPWPEDPWKAKPTARTKKP